MMAIKVLLYCDHVSSNAIHCNRYKSIHIHDEWETLSDVIAASSWTIEDGDVLCEEHHD